MAMVLIHVHALRHRHGLQPHSIPQRPQSQLCPSLHVGLPVKAGGWFLQFQGHQRHDPGPTPIASPTPLQNPHCEGSQCWATVPRGGVPRAQRHGHGELRVRGLQEGGQRGRVWVVPVLLCTPLCVTHRGRALSEWGKESCSRLEDHRPGGVAPRAPTVESGPWGWFSHPHNHGVVGHQ